MILIQTIKKVLKNNILDISIKDKNNFATISADQFIEIWSKKNNIFKLIEMIEIKRKKNFPCFLDSFEGIIKYLKNGIIIISCFGTIKIYNNIKSMRKHELSFIINVNSKIFNIRKNYVIFFNNFFQKKNSYNNKLYEDDKNNYSIIYFYKLKKYKLIKKIKINIKIPQRFDFLDDNRIIAMDTQIMIISLSEKKITKLQIKDNDFFYWSVLVNENKKIFFVALRDIYVFNSDNYQILNIIKLHTYVETLIPISQEEIGVIANLGIPLFPLIE